MEKRIEYIDLLKAFAIFCVVLGHTLQYGYNYGKMSFWANSFWAFIYSFHMPLFMMLSGFFATSSLKNSFFIMLKKKILRIFLPAYFWLGITLVIGLILCIFTSWRISEIPNWFPPFYDIFWYLNCLILCYAIFYISKKLTKSDISACIASCILFILLPGGYADNLNFMLPYFWIGYFLHKYDDWLTRHLHNILFISFINFIILSLFWSGRFTVYKYPIILFPLPSASYLSVLLYRYAIGIFGAIFFWSLAIFTMRKKHYYISILTRCGQYTLVIYIINVLCCEFYSRSPLQIYIYKGNLIPYNIISVVLSIFFIVCVLLIASILQRNRFARNYLLGKR